MPEAADNGSLPTGNPTLRPAYLRVLLAVLVGAAMFQQASRPAPGSDGAIEAQNRLQLELMGKYHLGLFSLLKANGIPLTEATEEAILVNFRNLTKTDLDKWHLVPIYAELAGKAQVRSYLDQLATASQGGFERDSALFRSIYESGATLEPEDRDWLTVRHGWFGELAVTWNQPDDPAHRRLMAAAGRTFLALFGLGSLAMLMGLAGLTLFVVFLARAYLGKPLQRRFAEPDGQHPLHIAWLEAFVLFMVIFLTLPYLARLLPFDTTAFSLLMLAAPFWLLSRGVGLREAVAAAGLYRGAGILKEIGSGMVGYLAGIPILFCGILTTFLLVKFTGVQPFHPIVFEFKDAGNGKLLGLFLLACVLAPLMEEILFRGIFYQYLRGYLHPLLSAGLCGLVFAAIHPQGWAAIPVLGSIGVVFCLLREWRGSLIAPMTAHALNNFLVLSLALLLFG